MIENTIKSPVDETTKETAAEPKYLPADYLANGYHAVTDKGVKYLRPEFVGEYAEIMAGLLNGMNPAAFNRLLREMKRSRKSTLPFEARLTAAAELLPKAMALASRKKAPMLLVTFIKHNLDNIHDDTDWMAFYRHLEAIAAYMTVQTGGDN